MKCLNENCDAIDIEKDDNFCYKCGEWTTKGYTFLKSEENVYNITHGTALRQNGRLIILGSLLAVSVIAFFLMLIIRGNDLFRPFFYIKKQVYNYKYGYNTTLLSTTNKYSKRNIDTYDDAIEYIVDDFNNQDVFCFNGTDVSVMADALEEKYAIPSVSFCDLSIEKSTKIKDVIDRMYSLFPNISGALTNISITNTKPKDEYVARFQPMYQFVNINEDIDSYNKVNKTQILLNSYYFLNNNNSNKDIESNNWYVKDAILESTIAHEFGHYISFLTILKKYNLDNITFVNLDNYKTINKIVDEYNSGTNSNLIVEEALNNYNSKYGANLDVNTFAVLISKYAATKDESGKVMADETIAEAIHDYYLHGDNMSNASKEIVSIIKAKL